MDNPRRDPVDHERSTRQHAGESMKNGANAPGLAGVAVAVVALIVGLFALATGHVVVGCIAARPNCASWQTGIPMHPAQQLTAQGVAVKWRQLSGVQFLGLDGCERRPNGVSPEPRVSTGKCVNPPLSTKEHP